jgi:ABC-2 type transport system ATP-binding protein
LEETKVIEVKNLTKVYGTHRAVDNISFTVNDGEILGFLGPNGAGKTTTMNMMTGFISSTDGSVTINGHDILEDTVAAKKELGYLPDVPPVYGDMRVDEYLNFVCDIKGVKKSERAKMLDDITETVGISQVRRRIVKNLSKGYRQRVGLAQAMVGYPSVLILDEPTVGLDPQQIIEMRSVIRKLGERHTILLSSHILSEVSAVCDRVVIINNGKIAVSKTLTELESVQNVYLVGINGDADRAVELLNATEGIESAEVENADGEYSQLRVNCDESLRATVVKTLVNAGIEVVMLKSGELTLEEVFLKVIKGDYEQTETKPVETTETEQAVEATIEETAEASEEQAVSEGDEE